MSYLLLVSNTPSENTQSMQDAVAEGALLAGFPCKICEPLSAVEQDVLNAAGIVLGTTENFAYMSGQLKDFLERIYYPCLEETVGLPWACFVSAGQDGLGAVNSVTRIITGLRWRMVQEPLILKAPFQQFYLDQCRELGQAMATGLREKLF